MKIIIISAEHENFVPQELKRVAEEKGYNVELINPNECYISISNEPYISYNGTKFLGGDICIPRMSEDNMEYKIAIIEHLEGMGIKCLNSGKGMYLASNKLECQIIMNKSNIKTPKSVMLTDDSQIEYAVKELDEKFPIIIKTIYGTHGIGVMRADSLPSLRSIVQQLLKTENQFILQEYIDHDKSFRIYILNGDILAAVERSTPPNDFRTNAHQGAELTKYDASEQEISLAKKCAELIGLNFVAVDYIKNEENVIILEVNGSPGYEALQKIVDFNISEKIINSCLVNTEKNKEEPKEIEIGDEIKELEKVETEIDLTNNEVVHNTNEIIGTVTCLTIKNFNDNKPIDARVDTGATHSSINGQDVIVDDTETTVKFRFGDYIYKFYLARMSNIKTPDNGIKRRPVIRVDIDINGNIIKNVEFNINERDHMKYDIILGRSTLAAADILINPSITKINDEIDKKEEE